MNHRSDAELVAAAKQDPEQFAELWERYNRKIFSYCYHMVGDWHDAEDVASETFLRAFARLEHTEVHTSYGALLYTIARNYVIDRRRRPYREVATDIEPLITETEPDAAQIIECRDSADEMIATLKLIRPFQASVLLLTYVHGFSHQEVGLMLNKSPSAVKSAAHRGRTAMAAML